MTEQAEKTRVNVYDYKAVADEGKPTLRGWFILESATRYQETGDWDDTVTHQDLLYTASGRWVRCNWDQWQGSKPIYWFISADQARTWLLGQNQDAAFNEHFGPVPEEFGPEPTSDSWGRLLNAEQARRLRAYAKENNTSPAQALRELVDSLPLTEGA